MDTGNFTGLRYRSSYTFDLERRGMNNIQSNINSLFSQQSVQRYDGLHHTASILKAIWFQF